MKASTLFHLLALFAAAFSLFSCEVPVRQPFNEAEFQWTRGKGTGAVEGQACIEMKDKSVNLGRRTYIVLFPVNAYTTELMTRKYKHGENVMGDDRMGRYLCDETADAEGRFSMRDLAPGEYYVGAMVDWVSEYWFPDNDNNLQKSRDHHSQFIYARVSVRNGQTTRVTSWNQGADWNMDTVLH